MDTCMMSAVSLVEMSVASMSMHTTRFPLRIWSCSLSLNWASLRRSARRLTTSDEVNSSTRAASFSRSFLTDLLRAFCTASSSLARAMTCSTLKISSPITRFCKMASMIRLLSNCKDSRGGILSVVASSAFSPLAGDAMICSPLISRPSDAATATIYSLIGWFLLSIKMNCALLIAGSGLREN